MNYHAILIDDEEIFRDSFKSLIPWQDTGFDLVATLEDGKEAISYIENNSVDLIITDIKMPIFSGIDIAKFGDSINIIKKRLVLENISILQMYDQTIQIYKDWPVLRPYV